MSNQWKEFFKYEAPRYDDESFTGNTLREVDFIISELSLAPGARVLDLGCGTGRHSIELSRRGYQLTSVDLSEDMLDVARSKAHSAGIKIEFVCQDAVKFMREDSFDACICLCEGALSLFGSPSEPYDRDATILRNIRCSLKHGGQALATVLNGCRLIRQYNDEDVASGRFDVLKTMDIGSAQELLGQPIATCERGYTPSELRLLAQVAGLNVRAIYGGTAGSWNKALPRLDEIELMLVAQRD